MSSHVIINIGINIPRCHLWKKIRNIECRQQFFGLMAQKKVAKEDLNLKYEKQNN